MHCLHLTKAMFLVADHSFLVTQRWDIRVGTSQNPGTLITLKCLDTSVLNTSIPIDKNLLITLTGPVVKRSSDGIALVTAAMAMVSAIY
jgi:hypothetical protein